MSRKGKQRLPRTALWKAWRAWQRRVGIDQPYRLHDARHFAGTMFQRRHKDVLLTKLYMGHSSLRSTERYLHPQITDLEKAIEEMTD